MCEVKIFLPLKKGTIERKTQTRVRFTLSLSPSLFLSGLFRSLSLSKSFAFLSGFEKKRGKKNRIKFLFQKGGFFQESHHFLLLLLRGIILSLRVKRGLEKREKTSAYKSNNNNKREKERTVLIIRRIDEAEKSRAYTNDDDDGSSSRRL